MLVPEDRRDPTVIPSSSLLGFLERFRWRLGARGHKYRPSAADLQEHPGGGRDDALEGEPLLGEGDDAGDRVDDTKNGRDRSATQSSRETANSLSSRGDLISSDEEEDAVPLDDEFALALGHRGESDADERRSGSTRRSTSGTVSSKTTTSSRRSRTRRKKGRQKSPSVYDAEVIHDVEVPSLSDLKKEEEQAELLEESSIDKKRKAAHKLASKQGLEKDAKVWLSYSLPLLYVWPNRQISYQCHPSLRGPLLHLQMALAMLPRLTHPWNPSRNWNTRRTANPHRGLQTPTQIHKLNLFHLCQ